MESWIASPSALFRNEAGGENMAIQSRAISSVKNTDKTTETAVDNLKSTAIIFTSSPPPASPEHQKPFNHPRNCIFRRVYKSICR